ncbi:hypothetical protein HK099_008685 [Clydaea vesicula]|uniref:Uncharacterized protein n=1 Tax=Clydaea vesicula TaxID=447962 RepID=A0AAD5XWR5_9FUNG|nr:hypothetical protein HK099_008685 [Clydaea vesicula]
MKFTYILLALALIFLVTAKDSTTEAAKPVSTSTSSNDGTTASDDDGSNPDTPNVGPADPLAGGAAPATENTPSAPGGSGSTASAINPTLGDACPANLVGDLAKANTGNTALVSDPKPENFKLPGTINAIFFTTSSGTNYVVFTQPNGKNCSLTAAQFNSNIAAVNSNSFTINAIGWVSAIVLAISLA